MTRGFVLLTTAAALIAALLAAGLALDVARLFIARSELQVFTDEAALYAAFQLDGSAAGLERARQALATGPGNGANRWMFATQPVHNATGAFAASAAGPFEAAPASAAGYRFVRVRVTSSIPLYFLPLLPGLASSQQVSAVSTAGQTMQPGLGEGLAPFSPDAHNPSDPNFGFTPGQRYTLRWPPPGQREKPGNQCSGDVGFLPAGGSADRGYIDVGQGSGSSAAREAIVNNSFFLPNPLTVGSVLTMFTGQDSVTEAMEQRILQDTDRTAATYAAYAGNGRRLLLVAVNNHADPAYVSGFAVFFLPLAPCGDKNTAPCCAEYVGAAVEGGTGRGAGGPGLYSVRMVP
ncbi:MAG: pilus assembly protein TadG-related protein [Bryobacteraceae bacterium]